MFIRGAPCPLAMRASLKYLKTYNVPESRKRMLEDFEEICKSQRLSQSSVIVSLIAKWVTENKKLLTKESQKKLELTQ